MVKPSKLINAHILINLNFDRFEKFNFYSFYYYQEVLIIGHGDFKQ